MSVIYKDLYGFIDINLSDKEVIKILSKPSEDLYPILLNNKRKYKKHGTELSAHEYLYLCATHKFKDKELKIKYKDVRNWLYESLKYIELQTKILKFNSLCICKLFKMPEEERNYKYGYVPDDSIIEAMFKNMNPNYDTIDRLIYYYFKSCFLFQTDILINYVRSIDEDANDNYLEGFNQLYNTNLENNYTPCFKIIEILKYFCKKEGALVSEYGINNYGTTKHVNLDLVFEDTAISFDPLTHGPNDIILVKEGKKPVGIKAFSVSKNISEKIDRIYNDVQDEFKDFKSKNKYDEYTMNYLLYIIDKLYISGFDKGILKQLVNDFNSINLSGIEYDVYFIRTQFKIINEVFKGRIIPTLVCSNIDGYAIDVVLCIKTLGDEYAYIRFSDNYIELIDVFKMKTLIDEQKIIITLDKGAFDGFIPSYRTIPGINKEFQIRCAKKYKKEVLPSVYEFIKNGVANNKEDIAYINKKKK